MKPLPLRELLGALVGDLIVAEAHAAKATENFMREAGFIAGKKGGTDDWGVLRFVTFSYPVEEPDGRKVRMIRVPLLSLLPIPLQQIDQTEYEFFAKVNEVDADLMCEVAPYAGDPAQDKKGAVPKVRVKLTLKQADLPAGLSSSLRRIEQASGSSSR